MIDLQQRTQKYVDVFLQLLPQGLYDNALDTDIAKDVQGHAKALAQADIDAQALLETIPMVQPELIEEYEVDFGYHLNVRYLRPFQLKSVYVS